MSAATIPTTATESKLARVLSYDDCTHCVAVPGKSSMIDLIHPVTGRTCCYGRTLEEVQAEQPGAVLMTVSEWTAAKAALQDAPILWEDTTAEAYEEMLNVLPPAAWTLGVFLVGEPWDHHAITGQPRFSCYRQDGETFRKASRPITRREFNEIIAAKRATL